MVLDFVESRVTNPVRLVDWGNIEEGQGVVCPCCGWTGRLGECEKTSVEGALVYACAQCEMNLIARFYPKIVPLRTFGTASEWRQRDRRAAVNY